MRRAWLRRAARAFPGPAGDPGRPVAGPARLDRSTKLLARRLRPGDVAVVDHPDLDRLSAQMLRDAGVAAVVNTAASSTGRYPNEGPSVLLAAGVPLLDVPGADLFGRLAEGAQVCLDGNRLLAGGLPVATGRRYDPAAVAAALEAGRAGLGSELEAFSVNTLEFLRRERDLLIDGVAPPPLRTTLAGRQVLVVVRGHDYREDLASLRPYIRDYRPVLIGVDGGADALLDAGLTPHLVVGDMDSVSDRALRCGAELVVHAYPDGRAPGQARLRALGLVPGAVFAVPGTSEDAALLLADAHRAELIVAVGAHATLVEFLDKGRAGMASTFLTRLRLGPRLVDAKGVSRLYRSRIGTGSLIALVAASLVAFAAALAVSEVGRTYLLLVLGGWHNFWHHLVH